MASRFPPRRAIALTAGFVAAALVVYVGWTSLTAPDTASVVDSLRAAGATVTERPSSGGFSFLHGSPHHLLVNGQDVWMYEYPAPALAEVDASSISADGSTFHTGIGPFGSTVIVDYIAPPHFYKTGRVIALYVGRDAETLRLLRLQDDRGLRPCRSPRPGSGSPDEEAVRASARSPAPPRA
ncbi:MAG TPA: hypothetical protein VHR15_08505, partial [Ktedonobacterales bacterium]|nr:hypothetical protein [Ktedonobacterales bacterium]